jgi:outer membrane protein assembly factor BamB
MKKNKNLISISTLFGALLLINASDLYSQDWPQWRGVNRDGKVTGFIAPSAWPGELSRQWTVTVGTGDATPALVGNKLYVFTRQGDNEVTLCLDAGTGEELWKDSYPAQAVTGAAAQHPGPRSSPAVAEGKIVTLGVGGVLSCLDAATGKLAWRKDPFPGVVPMFFTSMSPMITDGMCIAHLGGAGNGALLVFDLATGSEKWRWTLEGPEYASPVLMTVEGSKQIVTLTEKSIAGIALADGKMLWQLPFPTQRRAYNAATPIIDGQTVIYAGALRGTKAVKIEKQGGDFITRELWSNDQVAPQFNTSVLKDNLLFGSTSMSNLFCLNAVTGQTAWLDTTRQDRGGFAALLDAGPVILALPSSSYLIVLKPSEKEFTQLARIKVADTPTYAHPVIRGNRIYIKDQETIALWTIK